MAKFNSLVFNEVSGKMGAIVLGKNGVARQRITPKDPKTAAQQAVRNGFTNGSAAWKGLTSTQQMGWSVIAKQITLTNAVGKQYNPTGRTLYLSCYQNLRAVAMPAPTTAPYSLPVVPTVTGFTATVTGPTSGDPGGTIVFGGAINLSNYGVVIRATGPLSSDRSVLKPTDYRVLSATPQGGTLPAMDAMANLYTAKYGPLQPGMRIGFEIFQVAGGGFAGAVTGVIASADLHALAAAPAEDDASEDGLRRAA